MSKFKVGDIVKGIGNRYGITNEDCIGEVVGVEGSVIDLRVISYSDDIKKLYPDQDYTDKVFPALEEDYFEPYEVKMFNDLIDKYYGL